MGGLQAFAQTAITLDTSKNSYGPGDLIKITGQAAGSPNKLVAVEVKDPKGTTLLVRIVKTDQDGNFVLAFKLPSTAQSGIYNITANANIGGSTVRQETSVTATVPEFSSAAPLVLVASVVSILALSTKLRPSLKI